MNTVHGGQSAAGALKDAGVDVVCTLSGGHLFPLYDGCVKTGIRLVDTRHEQTATFAAEGWAKVTRRPGVAALTAGPGVTNGISAITSASLNGTPMLVIGGRAPQARWGAGSLQELDHLPIVASVTKTAATAPSSDQIPGLVDAALRAARTPHRGPAFVDVPLDAWGTASVSLLDGPRPDELAGTAPDADAMAAVAAGDLALMLAALADTTSVPSSGRERDAWVTRLRDEEAARRAREADDLGIDASPIRPARVYGELRCRLDRDAIVIGDGGDFVSY